jgi:DNA-binding HxlR family transcriptional regulator
MVLLDVLGQRWMMRILWELRNQRATFRELRQRCDNLSPTVLNTRLKTLKALSLIDLDGDGYGLTGMGVELVERFSHLDSWAEKWAKSLDI